MDKRKEFETQIAIVDRAEKLKLFPSPACGSRLCMVMDISLAKSADGRKLDYANLLSFPDGDFAHDIQGINAHIHREHDEKLGMMERFFSPRCGWAK